LKQLPNIMTGLRLVLTVLVFLALIALLYIGLEPRKAYEIVVGLGLPPMLVQKFLYFFAFWGFVIAAITDFFDGWLARRFDAVSTLGAILDPIADKVLVAGMIVGLAALGSWVVALAGGLMLFREFSVSAMREVLAPKGLKLPVTLMAKWKTTLQLVALTAELFVMGWSAWGFLPEDPDLLRRGLLGAHVLTWLAAAVTVWTGVEYALAARKALKASTPPPVAI
jgi:CDP-diacylglycerol--glycerol-3-phosphate 3-phosphatidyltransferase